MPANEPMWAIHHGVIIVFVAVAIVHLASAWAIWNAADTYREKTGDRLLLFPTWIWVLGGLLGGIFLATLFWMIHFSTLNPLMLRARNQPGEGPGPHGA